jgi:sporadic carbohydrate cluster protein (TIGR04323 family)
MVEGPAPDLPDRTSAQPSDLEAQLEQSLRTSWDARVLDYDQERFPFAEWVLDRIRGFGYGIRDLESLHETVPAEEVYVLSKRLCDATNELGFRPLVRDFILDAIAPHAGLVGPIAVQRFLNVRIMLPNRPQGVFPFHTGLLYGHGRASRSLWMPMTDVSGPANRTASMQIIHLDRSRELLTQASQSRLSIDEMSELFGRESQPVQAGPGQVCLFGQENIHGNYVNQTGKTRVSIDFRVAESCYGDQLARKIPGGYFEILARSGEPGVRPERVTLDNGRTNVIYLNNNTSATEGVPAHLQRYMVYDYCERYGLKYEFEMFELETMNHLPTLQHIVGELACNVILYSIYALPEDPVFRREVFDMASGNGVALYFVNEDLCVRDVDGREHVEELLAFAKYGL